MKRFGFVVVAAITLVSMATSGWGQENPAFELGTRAYGSYKFGGIDQTNLATGSTSVYIPLISYPQRGAHPPLEFGLNYTNRGFAISWSCHLVGGSNFFGFLNPPPAALCLQNGTITNFPTPYASGFSIIERSGAAGLGPGGGSSGGCQGHDPDIHGNYLLWDCSFGVTEWDGGLHQMAPVSYTRWEAIDGSGYRMDSIGGNIFGNPSGNSPSAGTVVLTDRAGIRSWGDPTSTLGHLRSFREDANGNRITWNEPGYLDVTTGYTDTMGRNIPSLVGNAYAASSQFLNAGTVIGGTITDTTGCTGPVPIQFAFVWTPPGPNGGTYPIKFCYVDIVETLPSYPDPNNPGTNVPAVPVHVSPLQSIVLPNGTAWTFEYTNDASRDLAKITFPTGGSLSYTWTSPPVRTFSGSFTASNSPLSFTFTRGIATRTLDPGNGGALDQTTYAYPTGFPFTTIVTDAAGNDTVHTFTEIGTQLYETQTQIYQGSSSSGTLLRTVQSDYSGPASTLDNSPGAVLKGQTTILPNGQQKREEHDYAVRPLNFISTTTGTMGMNWVAHYDNQGNFLGNYTTSSSARQISATREFDWGANSPGPLLRQTSITYLWQNDSNYLANNLIDLISSTTVFDGALSPVAQVFHGFDETPLLSSGITTQLNSSPPAPRGNPTSVTTVVSTPANSCNANTPSTTNIVTSTQWFDTGEVAKTVDALGNATTYGYSPAFAGALPTSECNALGQCATSNYDFNSGLKISGTDANSQITSFEFDNMKRLTKIINPAQVVNGSAISGTGTIAYTDTPGSLSVQNTLQQDGSTSISTVAFFDGLGRPVGSRLSDARGDVLTQITYDSMGRNATVTNPYRSTSDATYGITQTNYDALGRVTQVTHPDGSTEMSNYSGRAVQGLDAGNGTSRVALISQVDALGKLVSVCEVTSVTQANGGTPGACGLDIPGTGFLTTYRYDALGNLTGVNQGSMTRSFVYDSASRLVNATNPESGTTCYRYDANGNVLARVRPAPNQGNPNVTVTTNYTYDKLNRLTAINYSDGITPNVTKHYDTTSELGVTLNNTIGRLTAEYATNANGQMISGRIFSYDPMGRVVDNSQCVPQTCSSLTPQSVTYSYDLLGKPLTATNGEGVTFGYSYDSAGRLISMSSNLADAQHPGNLFSSAAYNALGSLTGGSVGGILSEALAYDCRGRLVSYGSSVLPATATAPSMTNSGCPVPLAAGVKYSSASESFTSLIGNNLLPDFFGSKRTLWKRPLVTGEPKANDFLVKLQSDRQGGLLADSILLSRVGKSGKLEHGSVTVTLSSTTSGIAPQTLTVAYGPKDSPKAIVKRLVKQFNHSRDRAVKARVRPSDTGVILEFVDRANQIPGFTLSVSVHSDLTLPSVRATLQARKSPASLWTGITKAGE